MKKKTIALLLVLMMVFGVSVGGTVAYLMDTKTVTNTFTIGNVTITLDESLVTPYGELAKYVKKNDGSQEIVALTKEEMAAEGFEQETVNNGNTYKLIPGHEYTKDPTIHVGETSEDCWLFVKVENGLETDATFTWSDGWSQVDATNYPEYWQYKDTVSKNADVPTFTKFAVSGTAKVDALGDKTIVVTAYAVQAQGARPSFTAVQAMTVADIAAWFTTCGF